MVEINHPMRWGIALLIFSVFLLVRLAIYLIANDPRRHRAYHQGEELVIRKAFSSQNYLGVIEHINPDGMVLVRYHEPQYTRKTGDSGYRHMFLSKWRFEEALFLGSISFVEDWAD